MSGKNYVGRTPVNSQDVVTKLVASNLVDAATPSQVSAASDVLTAASLKASKTYVDTQAATFKPPTYFQTQDALNVSVASRGAAGGVAALDSHSKIPLAQVPPVGAGFVLGPFGPTAGFSAETDATPVRIADWAIGVQSITFEPQVYCTILAGAQNMGRPVIEVGISDGTTTDYEDQVIVARGLGRTAFNDGQVINVMTIPAEDGHSGDDHTIYTPTYDIFMSAWLYDSQDQTVSVADGSILSGAVYLWRTTE